MSVKPQITQMNALLYTELDWFDKDEKELLTKGDSIDYVTWLYMHTKIDDKIKYYHLEDKDDDEYIWFDESEEKYFDAECIEGTSDWKLLCWCRDKENIKISKVSEKVFQKRWYETNIMKR